MERVGRHPNVLSFIGACTVPPNICMVSEYMSHGSVYDVLVTQRKFMAPADWKVIVQVFVLCVLCCVCLLCVCCVCVCCVCVCVLCV